MNINVINSIGFVIKNSKILENLLLKTGSTTLTNIILRWAEKKKLLVGLPPERHWELGGYPNFFRSRLLDPQAEKYEVLCHHQRLLNVLVKNKNRHHL